MLEKQQLTRTTINSILNIQYLQRILTLFLALITTSILFDLLTGIWSGLSTGQFPDSIILGLVSIIICVYFLVFLIIMSRFIPSIYPISLAIAMIILFVLTRNAIQSSIVIESGYGINGEMAIYLLVIGFLLLYTYIYTSNKGKEENLIRGVLLGSSVIAIVAVLGIILFLTGEGLPIFLEKDIFSFIFGLQWIPNSIIEPLFGALPLVWGTIITSIGAMIISVPLSIGAAIFIAEIASDRLKNYIKPSIELLAGIPSVVYGFFGMIVLVQFLQEPFPGLFFLASGSSSFAGMIILAIMALPTITSVAEEAISSVPQSYKEASLGLGASNWQTITKVTIPAANSGITAAIILGMGRAIGETMAIIMVLGNSAKLTFDIFSSMRTITGSLAIEMGEVAIGSVHYHALFGLALILLVLTLIMNSTSILIVNRMRKVKDTRNIKADKIKKNGLKHFLDEKRVYFKPVLLFLCLSIFSIFLLESLDVIPAFLFLLGFLGLYYFKRTEYNKLTSRDQEKFAFNIIKLVVVIVITVLLLILGFIVLGGLPAISLDFLIQSPRDNGLSGGIFPAIVGTFYLVTGAIIFSLPIGISAAIYLVEYQPEGKMANIIRSGFDLLNGTPSIVFGLFGFAFFVIALSWGRTMIAGQITLGLMILPTILRTTEESLKSVPQSVREGSLALGASKWQTIRRVVLPPAFPGIITGAILSIGRAAGETAPILFTAAVFFRSDLPNSLLEPVMALPYHLFVLSTNIPGSNLQRFGTALVLLTLVGGFYLIAILIRNYYRKRIQW